MEVAPLMPPDMHDVVMQADVQTIASFAIGLAVLLVEQAAQRHCCIQTTALTVGSGIILWKILKLILAEAEMSEAFVLALRVLQAPATFDPSLLQRHRHSPMQHQKSRTIIGYLKMYPTNRMVYILLGASTFARAVTRHARTQTYRHAHTHR